MPRRNGSDQNPLIVEGVIEKLTPAELALVANTREQDPVDQSGKQIRHCYRHH